MHSIPPSDLLSDDPTTSSLSNPIMHPIPPSNILSDDPTTSSLFDWSDFLDFNIDDTLNVSIQQPHVLPENNESQPSDHSVRVRKRDPMLVCPNFLAGRIPCACPELDEKLAEEDAALPGKKRAKAGRSSGNGLRCQVPGCEADIGELKGYHKRHRVCLRCANATVVVLDGESKRYCQQCGKFHILPDFDEGKRSCRRKLERHNNRRRRKPNDTKGGMEKESQQTIMIDDVSGDDDVGKADGTCVSSQIEERETVLETERPGPTPPALGSQNDSVVSVTTSGEIPIDREKQSPQFKRSPSYSENKSNFSSVCPTGRISFKLYDWNPAEFPRRLRHQIFQWLASMPVELEGYIRPGCTILTVFIAMPKPMWIKLLEEPALLIKGLVGSPGNMLFGRGTMLVYLNDMIFRVTKDATSVVKVKVKRQSPKLHYIHPTFFEAGKPMEFVACGSDLLQPKFRFLLSVAGRYLAYKISVSSTCCMKRDTISCNHQLLNIYVPQTDMHICGPMFIEVENHSGLSNFIPILIGDKDTCAEMDILQQKFEESLFPEQQSSECEAFASRQEQFSEFVLDVAWSLKKPEQDQLLTSFHIQRLNCLLTSLTEKESSIILKRVICSLKPAIDNNLIADVPDFEMKLLRKNMDIAQNLLDKKLQEKGLPVISVVNGSLYSQSFQNDAHSIGAGKDIQRIAAKNTLGMGKLFQFVDEAATVPLLNEELIMNIDNQRPGNSCSKLLLTRTFLNSKPLIMAVMVVGVCFGVCAMVLHPQRVLHIATTIRTCLFSYS